MKVMNTEELEHKLNDVEAKLRKTKHEKEALKKAIWDLLNHAQIFILVLDYQMNIVLINHNFATKIGFKDEKEPIGRCWLDFIKENERDQISSIHHIIAEGDEDKAGKYREAVNDIVRLDGKTCTIKWFNFPINHDYHLTFSIGIPAEIPTKITEESIRSYYQNILEKDRTMILSLRDSVIEGLKAPVICDPNI